MVQKISINPERDLGSGANVGSAFATQSPKAALSSLRDVVNFNHTDKGLYRGKNC